MSRIERVAIPALTPELELLTGCVRARLDPAWEERVALALLAPLDWRNLIVLSAFHGVTPLVHLELERQGSANVPLWALETLRRDAGGNAAHQMRLVSELRDLLDGIRRLGIVAVPFQGPALAASLYGNLALREAGGLDLLVRRRDVPAVTALLLGRGYRESGGSSLHLDMLRHDGVGVELRHALQRGPLDAEIEEAWSTRLHRGSLLGREIRLLAPMDLLRMLCVVGSERGWERLIWASDVAEVLHRHPEIEWERLWGEAERLRATRALRLGLAVAHAWLGAPLSPGALGGARNAQALFQALDAPLRAWQRMRERAARWSSATRHAS